MTQLENVNRINATQWSKADESSRSDKLARHDRPPQAERSVELDVLWEVCG